MIEEYFRNYNIEYSDPAEEDGLVQIIINGHNSDIWVYTYELNIEDEDPYIFSYIRQRIEDFLSAIG